jgi:hypothetical protein
MVKAFSDGNGGTNLPTVKPFIVKAISWIGSGVILTLIGYIFLGAFHVGRKLEKLDYINTSVVELKSSVETLKTEVSDVKVDIAGINGKLSIYQKNNSLGGNNVEFKQIEEIGNFMAVQPSLQEAWTSLYRTPKMFRDGKSFSGQLSCGYRTYWISGY